MEPVQIKVVEAIPVNNLVIVACDLLSGELIPGIKLARDNVSGVWELVNISSVSPELFKQGRRGITLRPIEGAANLSSGVVLATD